MKYLFNIFWILLISFTLAGCKTATHSKNSANIEDAYNFEKKAVKGGDFQITTYQKVTNENMPYVFYIEGDGAAFDSKYRVSRNPTPRSRMLINLAAMDDRPNVVYIARPCQYTPQDLNPKCRDNQYWTDKRLSDDSVAAINEVINNINNGSKFSLVGYSGGGGIAVLVAARNPRVKDIITLAGNIDIDAFTGYHNVTPMLGSLNPIDYAEKVKNIPQLHISGGKDKIVPPFIADNFVKKASSKCVKQEVFSNATHDSGLERSWKDVYTQPITCY